jgi:branched-chain amino acid transport system ATP-binding protein
MTVIRGWSRPRRRLRAAGRVDTAEMPTPQVVRRDVGSMLEARRLFPAMTVRENLLMGTFVRADRAAVMARRWVVFKGRGGWKAA